MPFRVVNQILRDKLAGLGYMPPMANGRVFHTPDKRGTRTNSVDSYA